jgi:hypothetical protein
MLFDLPSLSPVGQTNTRHTLNRHHHRRQRVLGVQIVQIAPISDLIAKEFDDHFPLPELFVIVTKHSF